MDYAIGRVVPGSFLLVIRVLLCGVTRIRSRGLRFRQQQRTLLPAAGQDEAGGAKEQRGGQGRGNRPFNDAGRTPLEMSFSETGIGARLREQKRKRHRFALPSSAAT